MKRCISFILAAVLIFSFAEPALAEEPSLEYRSIPVEYSDNIGHRESLDCMVHNGHLYVDAMMLAQRLGYTFGKNGDGIVIFNRNESNGLPVGVTKFYSDSTKVSHMLFNRMVDTYEAPFASIVNERGSWIPLEYSLKLLNSGITTTKTSLRIDCPSKSILDYFYDISKNSTRYMFDWMDDFGYTETTIKVLGGSSHLVNLFNGILEKDGASWVALFQQFIGSSASYDKKYGEAFAILLCSESEKELQEAAKRIELLGDLLSEDGDLGSLLSFTVDMTDFEVGTLYQQCEAALEGVMSGNGSPSVYNKSYQALEKAMDKQTWFSHTGENILEVQKGVSSAAGEAFTLLDIAVAVSKIVGYEEEFQNQDEFGLAAIMTYLNTANSGQELPRAMKQSIIDYSDALSQSIHDYGVKRFKDDIDQWIQWIVKTLKLDDPLHSTIGAPGAAVLIAWDIVSNTMPFFVDGLNESDNFELALYSMVFQSDAFLNYINKRNVLFGGGQNITADELYELTQYCYIYLKSCYVTREAALAALTNDPDSASEKVKPLVASQNAINSEIARILVKLKEATTTNGDYKFGFLPSDNERYLVQYDDSLLIRLTNKRELPLNEVELADTYIEFLESKNYQPYISDWIFEPPNKYAIFDINKDGIEELIITGGDFGFYNFSVFSYDNMSKEIYPLSIPGNIICGEQYKGNVAQYYGSLQYSPTYHALVFTELHNGPMFDNYEYVTIEEQKLVCDFSIWYESDSETDQTSYGISNSDGREILNKTNYDSYINELIVLDWNDIPRLP